MYVSTALQIIDSIKHLEEKTRNIYQKMDSMTDKQLEILKEIGIDKDYIREVFIKFSSTREYYERDLGSQEIDCKW